MNTFYYLLNITYLQDNGTAFINLNELYPLLNIPKLN